MPEQVKHRVSSGTAPPIFYIIYFFAGSLLSWSPMAAAALWDGLVI